MIGVVDIWNDVDPGGIVRARVVRLCKLFHGPARRSALNQVGRINKIQSAYSISRQRAEADPGDSNKAAIYRVARAEMIREVLWPECPNCGARGTERCHDTEGPPARYTERHKERSAA